MTNNDRFMSPPQVAKLLGVGADKVVGFIQRGELQAVNLSMADRPRWKIEPAALRRFIESRSNHPKPTPKPKRRSPLPTPAKEYV